jgi:hypothetical protein
LFLCPPPFIHNGSHHPSHWLLRTTGGNMGPRRVLGIRNQAPPRIDTSMHPQPLDPDTQRRRKVQMSSGLLQRIGPLPSKDASRLVQSQSEYFFPHSAQVNNSVDTIRLGDPFSAPQDDPVLAHRVGCRGRLRGRPSAVDVVGLTPSGRGCPGKLLNRGDPFRAPQDDPALAHRDDLLSMSSRRSSLPR